MEFRFRAGDDRPSSTTVRYFSSERTILGRSVLPSWAVSPPPPPPPSSGSDPTHFPDPDCFTIHDPILHPTNARDAMQRQMEKDRIREEILAARRRVLEAEVRRELMMEQQIALKKAVGNGLDPMQAQSFDLRLGFSSRSSSPLATVPRLPETVPGNMEVNKELTPPAPPPELNKEKLIVPAKPNPDLSGLKRKKLPSEGPNELYRCTVKKKKKIPKEEMSCAYEKLPKEEWSCALCQVTVANEKMFEGHLNGKRHKASEKRLGAGILVKISSNAPILKNNSILSAPKELEITAAASSQLGDKKERDFLEPHEVGNSSDKKDASSQIGAKEERGLLDPNEAGDGSDKKDASSQIGAKEEGGLLDANEAGDGSDKKDTGISEEKTSEEKKVELLVQKVQSREDSRNNVEVKTVDMMQRKEEPTKTKRFEFLCEICKVGSNDPKVMEKHGRGRKHLDKLKELKARFQNTDEANVNTPTTKFVAASGTLQEAVERLQQDTQNTVAAVNVMKEANASIPTTTAVASLMATEKAETARLQASTYVTKDGNVSIPTTVAVNSWGGSEETETGRLIEESIKNNAPTTNVTKEANANMLTNTSVVVESSWATEAAEKLRKLESYEKLIKTRLTE